MTLNQKEWLDAFPALENVNRFNIMILLDNEGESSFSRIKSELELTDGNCAHHLNVLLERGLVDNSYRTPSQDEREYSMYHLSKKGRIILERLLD